MERSQTDQFLAGSEEKSLSDTGTAANIYRPLNTERNEIRLLLVKPGCGVEPVRCDLQHAFLASDDFPEYEAISYCWGEPTARAIVYANDQAFSVPASAEAALRGMRLSDSDRLLWIDALSVNQDDSSERSHQVGIMYEVYSKSRRTLVWLGGGMPPMDEVMKSFNLVLDDAGHNRGSSTHLRGLLSGEGDILPAAFASEDIKTAIRALGSIYAHPWFTRLWVVQEVALANSSLCMCSGMQLPLSSILSIAAWLHEKRLDLLVHNAAEIGIGHAIDIFNAVDLKSTDVSATYQRTDFLELLRYFRSSRTSDPRDHVYGLIGLYRWLHPHIDLPGELGLDYRKPLEQVLLDATRYSIRETGDLYLFSHLDAESASEISFDCRPSWVPAWNLSSESSQRPRALAHFFRSDNGNSLAELIMEHGQHRNTLPVLGFQVDRISTITSAMMHSGSHRDISTFVDESLKASMVAKLYDDVATPIPDPLACTWTAGQNFEQRAAASNDLADCAKWYSLVTSGQRISQLLERYSPAGKRYSETTQRAVHYHYAFRRACRRRRFFVTYSGYIGLAPSSAKLGDIAVILYGCPWPVVLRPWKGSYKIIGTCYVHGIMFGEAAKKHKEEGKEDEMFHLS